MLTVGLWWPELRRSEVVGEVRRREGVELAEEGRRRVPSGFWMARIHLWRVCGANQGVRKARGSPVA